MERDAHVEEITPASCAQRQQFTGHERDQETELDYMLARYYGRGVGRFLSVDPLMNSAHPENPQTWNRYSYVENNPLRFRDPLGLFKWAAECRPGDAICGALRQWFRDSVATLKVAASGLKAGSNERKKVDDALKRIGEEGKGGLKVAFGPLDGNLGFAKGSKVTFDLEAVGNQKSGHRLSASEGSALDAGLVGHEAEHAGSGPLGVAFLTFSSERTALRTESFVYQGLRTTDRLFGLWNESWAAVDRARVGQLREGAIQKELDRRKEKQ